MVSSTSWPSGPAHSRCWTGAGPRDGIDSPLPRLPLSIERHMSHLRATSGRRPHRAPRSAVVAQGLAPPAVVTLLMRTRVLVAGIMLSGRCPMDESQEVRPWSATLETDGSIEVDLAVPGQD